MRKRIALALVLVMAALLLASCGNEGPLNLEDPYYEAVIGMPDGTVVCGEVQTWQRHPYCDLLKVKIDGVTYVVHSSDVVLMNIP